MKYKLIKELPFENSPKIGYISTTNFISNDKAHYWNHNWFYPENYPEFWELVVEKDYEILSLKYHNDIYNLAEKDIFRCKEGHIKLTTFLGNLLHNINIHSVKRLSDGEIFTIGDKVKGYNIDKEGFEIKHIFLSHEFICFANYNNKSNFGGRSCYLNNDYPQKIKQPLFTTEDGIDIFRNDIFWNVDATFYKKEMQITNDKYSKDFLIIDRQFSTKEKAEEYIILNKPCLSINDVAKVFVETNYTTNKGNIYPQGQKLRDLVKSKIK